MRTSLFTRLIACSLFVIGLSAPSGQAVAQVVPPAATAIETDGHIGHGAILHGCLVRENAMVGMNAVVMDGAVVGVASIVAAMSGATSPATIDGITRQSPATPGTTRLCST